MSEKLLSKIVKTENVPWKNLKPIQHSDFKEFPEPDKDRLKKSIQDNSFIQPFYVWQDGKEIYCLDGYHRIQTLIEMERDGLIVPEMLPATFIECVNKEHAAKLVLLYSSQYARITPGGFEDFMRQYNLDEDLMRMEISIPGITDVPRLDDLPYPDELTADAKDKPAVMRITFPTADELESTKPIIEGILKERVPGYLISVSAGEI